MKLSFEARDDFSLNYKFYENQQRLIYLLDNISPSIRLKIT